MHFLMHPRELLPFPPEQRSTTSQNMKRETPLACRRLFDEHQATQRQPQGGDQNAGQPTEALLPGEDADATPELGQPVRDLRQPKAERLLHAGARP